jgi:hypothetical protein
MAARSVECKCEQGRFTCGYCLRNAKPWLWTPRTWAEIIHDQIWAPVPKVAVKARERER